MKYISSTHEYELTRVDGSKYRWDDLFPGIVQDFWNNNPDEWDLEKKITWDELAPSLQELIIRKIKFSDLHNDLQNRIIQDENNIQRNYNMINTEIKDRKAADKVLQDQIDDLKRRMTEAEKRITDLEKRMDEAERQINLLWEEIRKIWKEIEKLWKEIEKLWKKIGEIEEKLGELENRIKEVEREITKIKTDITNIQTEITRIKTRVQALEDKVFGSLEDTLNTKLPQMEGKLSEIEQKISTPTGPTDPPSGGGGTGDCTLASIEEDIRNLKVEVTNVTNIIGTFSTIIATDATVNNTGSGGAMGPAPTSPGQLQISVVKASAADNRPNTKLTFDCKIDVVLNPNQIQWLYVNLLPMTYGASGSGQTVSLVDYSISGATVKDSKYGWGDGPADMPKGYVAIKVKADPGDSPIHITILSQGMVSLSGFVNTDWVPATSDFGFLTEHLNYEQGQDKLFKSAQNYFDQCMALNGKYGISDT